MDDTVTITWLCDRCQREHRELNGAWVRARRLQEGWTAAAFADAIGVDKYALRGFEAGHRGLSLGASRRALAVLNGPSVELT